MNKESELDCYLYYVWNAFSLAECKAIFGKRLGEHIWEKYSRARNESWNGAPSALYAQLDPDCRRAIVERAVAHYNK